MDWMEMDGLYGLDGWIELDRLMEWIEWLDWMDGLDGLEG